MHRSDVQVLYSSIHVNLLYHSQGLLFNRIQVYLWHESSSIKSVWLPNDATVVDVQSMSATEAIPLEPSDDRVIPFSVIVWFLFHVGTEQ